MIDSALMLPCTGRGGVDGLDLKGAAAPEPSRAPSREEKTKKNGQIPSAEKTNCRKKKGHYGRLEKENQNLLVVIYN